MRSFFFCCLNKLKKKLSERFWGLYNFYILMLGNIHIRDVFNYSSKLKIYLLELNRDDGNGSIL